MAAGYSVRFEALTTSSEKHHAVGKGLADDAETHRKGLATVVDVYGTGWQTFGALDQVNVHHLNEMNGYSAQAHELGRQHAATRDTYAGAEVATYNIATNRQV